MLGDLAAEEDGFFLLAVGERAHFAHAPVADHVTGDIGGALDVVAGAGGEVAEENLLRSAATHQHAELCLEEFLRVGVLVVDGQLHRDAQGHAARDDGDLVDGIGARGHGGDHGVAGLMVGGVPFLFLGEDHGLALDAHQDLVLGHLEIVHGHTLAALAGGPQRRFVHQIGQVGAGEARRAAGDDGEFHVFRKGHLARVHAEDFLAALPVGARDHHAAVEAAGAQQGRVEHVGTIGGGDEDDALV